MDISKRNQISGHLKFQTLAKTLGCVQILYACLCNARHGARWDCSLLQKAFIQFSLSGSSAGATGRSSSSFASISKPPPYNVSKPSTKLDINTVTKPSVTHKAKVLYDYDASESDELSLLADEVCIGVECFLIKLLLFIVLTVNTTVQNKHSWRATVIMVWCSLLMVL